VTKGGTTKEIQQQKKKKNKTKRKQTKIRGGTKRTAIKIGLEGVLRVPLQRKKGKKRGGKVKKTHPPKLIKGRCYCRPEREATKNQ